jgi:putative transposase
MVCGWGFSRPNHRNVVSGFSRTITGPPIAIQLAVRTRRPKHLATFDYLGPYRYFLTFCTFNRGRLFVTKERVDLVVSQILRAAECERFALIAYCFMPDHVHLLVQGLTDRANCRRFIACAKQFAGYSYKKAFGGSLWQRYGYERTLRKADPTLSVARYIVENPVRAGLVRCVSDYPFLGSSTYTLNEILDAIQLEDQSWSG